MDFVSPVEAPILSYPIYPSAEQRSGFDLCSSVKVTCAYLSSLARFLPLTKLE